MAEELGMTGLSGRVRWLSQDLIHAGYADSLFAAGAHGPGGVRGLQTSLNVSALNWKHNR